MLAAVVERSCTGTWLDVLFWLALFEYTVARDRGGSFASLPLWSTLARGLDGSFCRAQLHGV